MPIDDVFSGESLQRAVRRGTGALVVAQIVSQLISVLSLAVLFRLIAPDQYGLLGMVIPVLMFVRIFATLGLHVSTVQRKRLTSSELSGLFWLQIVLGFVTAAVTAMMAPAVALFYGKRELTAITLALAGTSVASALGSHHQALMERQLKLGRLALARIVGQLGGASLAIAAAWAGWNVWALVIQQYVELCILAMTAWFLEPWRPQRPRLSISLRPHLRLGGYFAASSVMFFLATNLDKVLVGRLQGEHALGLYSQAFNLMIRPVYLVTTPLTGVILASLSRTAHEPAAREELLERFYRMVAIVLFPTGIGLFLVGNEGMQLLGGSDWRQAGPILQALSLAIVAQGFVHIAFPVFSAAGRTDRLFYSTVAMTLILIPVYLAGNWFGRHYNNPPLGVAYAYSAAMITLLCVPVSSYCLRSSGYAIRPVAVAVFRPLLCALAMGMIVWATDRVLAHSTPQIVRLCADVGVGVLVYGLLARGDVVWLRRQWREGEEETGRGEEESGRGGEL